MASTILLRSITRGQFWGIFVGHLAVIVLLVPLFAPSHLQLLAYVDSAVLAIFVAMRLRDIGLSPWWAVLIVAPAILMVVAVKGPWLALATAPGALLGVVTLLAPSGMLRQGRARVAA